MAGDILERRRRARGKLLGAPAQFKSIGVELDGEFYAVREPTVGERAAINKAGMGANEDVSKGHFDMGNFQVAGMMACVFVGEPVLGEDGKPVSDPLPALDAKNEPVLGADGNPKLELFPRVLSGFTPAERVFEQTDLQGLVGQPVSGFVNAFLPVVQRLLNPKTEDARKSAGGP